MKYPEPIQHHGGSGQPLSESDFKRRLEWIREFIRLNNGIRPTFVNMSEGWGISTTAVANTIGRLEEMGWIEYEYQDGTRRRGTLSITKSNGMMDLSHLEMPRVTVVINTYQRPRSLEMTFNCLKNQYHTDWANVEIVVVNDGSHNEDYQRVIGHFMEDLPLRYFDMKRRDDDKPQLYMLKNFGVEQSTFKEVVWLLDDDLTFDNHTLFILRLYHMFLADRAVIYPHYADPREPHHFQAPFAFQPQPTDWDKVRHWPAFAGMSVRYDDWQVVGGVDEDYDGAMGFADLDIGIRLWKAGCQIILADGITCFIDDRETGSHRDRFLEDHRNGKLFMEKVGLEEAAKYGVTP